MLKTISSITNAIGALNYKGTWNASTNTPTLASGVGTKGDYYVVSVAGSTTLDGISNWGVGDLATYNGSVWQRVEGGADLNGVNLSVSGTTTLSGLTASTALALDASKNVVSVTNTGTGDNVLATAPTLVGDVSLSTGNLVIGTSGKGIQGTATNNNADAGVVGEYISAATVGGSAVSLTNNIGANVVSISLTSGDWDVSGMLGFNQDAATIVTYITGGPSTTSATLASGNLDVTLYTSTGTTITPQVSIINRRISIASTTTVYLVAQAGFSTSTLTAYGSLFARRIR